MSAHRTIARQFNPAHFFALDETTGSVMGNMGSNGTDGSYVNTPTLGATGAVVGSNDTSVTFASASSEHAVVTSGGTITGSAARTVSFWLKKPSGGSQFATALAWGANVSGQTFRVGIDESNGRLRVQVVGGNRLFTTNVTDDEWHHCCVVLPSGISDVNGVLAYVDGDLESETSVTSQAINTASSNLYVGCNESVDKFINGTIDEVAIYATDLSAGQVDALYKSGISGLRYRTTRGRFKRGA